MIKHLCGILCSIKSLSINFSLLLNSPLLFLYIIKFAFNFFNINSIINRPCRNPAAAALKTAISASHRMIRQTRYPRHRAYAPGRMLIASPSCAARSLLACAIQPFVAITPIVVFVPIFAFGRRPFIRLF